MTINNDIKLDFSDVLILPQKSNLSSRKEVDLVCTYTFKHSKQTYSGVPIMAANMDGVGTFEMHRALAMHKIFTCLVKSYTSADFKDQYLDYEHFAISTGTSKNDLDNVDAILSDFPRIKFICVDVANGYSKHFVSVISAIRIKYPNITIIAGNVVTPEMTQELIHAGADLVKIGIGSSAVCTTRVKTGIGYPQFSAVFECSKAADELGARIISDGGCTCPGDLAKAFGAGSDFVMLGSMLAGHNEGGGSLIRRSYLTDRWSEASNSPIIETKHFVQFYGMSSDTAMHKHHGGVADYRSSEGRTVEIPHRGNVAITISDILGGLRSCCTYTGSSNLNQLSTNASFIRVNNQFNNQFAKYTSELHMP